MTATDTTIDVVASDEPISQAGDAAAAVSELAAVYEALERDDLTEAELDALIARRRALERMLDALGGTHPRGVQ